MNTHRGVRRAVTVLVALATSFGLALTSAAAPSYAKTSYDGIITLDARANQTVATSTSGNFASYRIQVDLDRIAQNSGVHNPFWWADVTITGPGNFRGYDDVWAGTNSWRPIWFDAALPGTYTVTAYVSVTSGTWDDSLGDYDELYGRTIQETFVLQAAPKVSAGTPATAGTAKVGSVLTAKPGKWAAGTKFSYQWFADGKAIGNGMTLKLTPTLAGKKITVRVTGTKPGYNPVSKTAGARTVSKGNLTAAAPAIAGTAKVGTVLTARPGKWTAGTRFSYQWLANGKTIAKGKTLKLTPALRGKKIKVRVTGAKPGYMTVSRISKATTVTKPPASAAPRTVLGQKNLFGRYGRGWGTPRPKMIFNGGDPSGLVSNIRWGNWGSKIAFGQGQGWAFKPGGGYYAKPVRVQLKASNIGRITKNGPRVYKHLTARFQKRPGGAWQKWSGWLNLRDGAWNGRITR